MLRKEEILGNHLKKDIGWTEAAMLAMEDYANQQCSQLLQNISDTFLKEENLKKAPLFSDRAVFEAVGETIKNFPLPNPPNNNQC